MVLASPSLRPEPVRQQNPGKCHILITLIDSVLSVLVISHIITCVFHFLKIEFRYLLIRIARMHFC